MEAKQVPTIVVVDLRDEPRCDRCWKRTEDVADRGHGTQLCDRCTEAVKDWVDRQELK